MHLYHNITFRCGDKMFLAFLSLAVIGIALFVAVVAFYSRKDTPERTGQEYFESAVEDRISDQPPTIQESVITDSATERNAEHGHGGKEGTFIPILRIDEKIPGLKGRELIHFVGKGALYSLESTAELENLKFAPEDLELAVDGRLILTSRYIIVYSGAVVKKFTIAAIENFLFRNSFLVMKRKRVKTKKDVLKVSGDLGEFKYILHALT